MTALTHNKINLALFATFLVLYSIFFLNSFFPFHDTFYTYSFFNIAYSDFFYNKEIIQWLPYSSHGVSSDWYFFNCMTVFKYFFIVTGAIFHISDSFLLFKVSMLFEQAVFLFGLFLLSRTLFKHTATILFVCICAVGSLVLANQAGLNFYSYYLFPLVLHYMFRYFEEGKPSLLLLSLVILLLAVPGQAVYFLFIFAMELLVIMVVMFYCHRRDFRQLITFRRNDLYCSLGYFCSAVLILSALAYSSFKPMEHFKTLSIGRDLVTKHTPLDVFLTYGGLIGFGKFKDLIIPEILKATSNLDMTLFTGIIALPFVLYAFRYVRKPQFIAVTLALVVMGLFSLGGVFSTITYYVFPGMKYYRHIGLSIAIFKLFIPLMAGYGLDAFITRNSDDTKSRPVWFATFLVTLLIMDAAIWHWAGREFTAELRSTLNVFMLSLSIAAICIFFLRNSLATCLLIALCVEMLGYQAMVHKKIGIWKPETIPRSFTHIEKPSYLPARTIMPVSDRFAALSGVFQSLLEKPFAMYNLYYNFYLWDPCQNGLRADFVNRYTAAMIEARGGSARDLSFIVPLNDGFTINAIACNTPKLRFVSDVIYTNNEQESINYMRNLSLQNSSVILAKVPESLRKQVSPLSGSPDAGISVTDFSYNKLQAVLNVSQPEGAWMYYADGYHPFWQAKLDNVPAEIYQANNGFKALHVPNGSHTLSLVFKNSFGALFSLYTTITAGLLFTLICIYGMVNTLLNCISGNNKISTES